MEKQRRPMWILPMELFIQQETAPSIEPLGTCFIPYAYDDPAISGTVLIDSEAIWQDMICCKVYVTRWQLFRWRVRYQFDKARLIIRMWLPWNRPK